MWGRGKQVVGEHYTGRNSPKRSKTFSPGAPLLSTLPDAAPDSDEGGPSSAAAGDRARPNTFRILIIGRANSGKTTILQKICQTEKPVVRRIMRGMYHTYMDREGINVKQYWAMLSDPNPSPMSPSRERGVHDIWNEITFPSTPGFVFHDSFGIESGAIDEWEVIQHFIKTRAGSSSLEERLHAIWFCLPTDTDRPLLEVERSFFATETQGVPIVAVFTKFDAQSVKAYENLRRQGVSRKLAWLRAPSIAQNFLRDYLEPQVMGTPHPPAACVCLENMHKSETSCTALVRCTANALTDENLRKIFIATQKNNIKLCVEFAIHNNFHETLQRGRTVSQNLLSLAAWFPLSSNKEMFKSQQISSADFNQLSAFVSKVYHDVVMSKRSSYMMAAQALIILENCSYRPDTLKENIAAAIDAYKASGEPTKLRARIKKEYNIDRTDEQLQRWLYEVICDNLLDHSQLAQPTRSSPSPERGSDRKPGLGLSYV